MGLCCSSRKENPEALLAIANIYPQKRSKAAQYYVKLDPDFDNPKWIARHKHMFNFLDTNKDGSITLNEIVSKASNDICKNLGATAEQTRRHQECVEAFFRGCGMEYDKEVEWPEYIEGWKKLSTAELDKWANSELTLIRKWGDALFDILDTDGNNSITIDEWKRYGRIAGIIAGEEDCERTFAHCDLDKSGELDVEEMTRQHLGFWYTLDPKADGLYGGAVP
jgi:Ca2+-binding EF-hand superfamily protein